MSGPSKRKKDETKSEYQNDLGQQRYVKGSGRMLLNNERDRIVEDERDDRGLVGCG
jgi:hypothetical protein